MLTKLLRSVAAIAMAVGMFGVTAVAQAQPVERGDTNGNGYCCDYDFCDKNSAEGDCCQPTNGAGFDCCDLDSVIAVAIDPCVAPVPEPVANSSASVRGTAFEDLNANGKRDAGEPTMSGAWLKLSGGGSWFVCAYTGADATYAIPVVDVSATYIVFPIAPVGWKTTTPVIKTKTVNTTNGFAFLYNDMGFVRDPSVKTVDGCDQYNPSRPVPPGA
ncbi:MAG: hypothetical protein ABIQ99_12705 [Thermoflexales bacterium]